MAAGVEIVILPRKRCHAAQIVTEHTAGKRPCVIIFGTKIHGIGAMGNQRAKSAPAQQLHGSSRVRGILRLCFAASGVSGKERKGVGTDGLGSAHHILKAVGCGQVASDVIHHNTPPESISIA